MKYIQAILFFLILCFSAASQTVIAVHDADTYKVLVKGKVITVRLKNIDGPELDQFMGKQIRDSIAALLLHRQIELDVKGTDLYGRALGDVKIDGQCLDSLLIAKGWAWFYLKYSHNLQLNIYEAAARKKGLGLWKCEYNIPPWIWRNLNKRNKRLYEVCR